MCVYCPLAIIASDFHPWVALTVTVNGKYSTQLTWQGHRLYNDSVLVGVTERPRSWIRPQLWSHSLYECNQGAKVLVLERLQRVVGTNTIYVGILLLLKKDEQQLCCFQMTMILYLFKPFVYLSWVWNSDIYKFEGSV